MATDLATDTGLASARERAAAILYGNEKAIEPIGQAYQSPVVAEYSVPLQEEAPRKANFHGYVFEEPQKIEKTGGFRSYEVPAEVTVGPEPKVYRPFVDVRDMKYETPADNAAEAEHESALDMDLDDDTAYVVRFKAPTVITAAAVAVVFMLLAVLFVVNAVAIANSNYQLEQLRMEQAQTAEELAKMEKAANDARELAIKEIEEGLAGNPNYGTPISKGQLPADKVVPYEPAPNLTAGTNFFDIICKFLSSLFG